MVLFVVLLALLVFLADIDTELPVDTFELLHQALGELLHLQANIRTFVKYLQLFNTKIPLMIAFSFCGALPICLSAHRFVLLSVN